MHPTPDTLRLLPNAPTARRLPPLCGGKVLSGWAWADLWAWYLITPAGALWQAISAVLDEILALEQDTGGRLDSSWTADAIDACWRHVRLHTGVAAGKLSNTSQAAIAVLDSPENGRISREVEP